MTPYNFAILLFAFTSIFIGLLIGLKRRDWVGAVYFLYSTAMACWGIPYAIMISPNISPEIALISGRIANAGAMFIPVTFYHFSLLYTETRSKGQNLFLRLQYAAAFLVLIFSQSQLFIPFVRPSPPFPFYPAPGPLYYFFTVSFWIILPFAFIHLIEALRRATGDARTRLLGIVVSAILGYLGGLLTFFPIYDIHVPQYAIYLMPLYPFGIGYFMIRHHLLDEHELALALYRERLASIGMMTACLNHEIRNPLYLIRSLGEAYASDVLEKRISDQAEKAKKANEIIEKSTAQATRALKIVSRLSNFAKQNSGQEPKFEEIKAEKIFDNIMPLLSPELDSVGVNLKVGLPDSLPSLRGDISQLEGVFFNLILNSSQAIKRSGRKGEINITGNASEGVIEIIFKDTGPGISEKDLKHVFDPFYTTKKEGMGLGLYIAKNFTEKNRGKISIASKPGEGTTVTLRFPLSGKY